MSRRGFYVPAISVVLWLLLAAVPAMAGPGDPDAGWGGAGVETFDFGFGDDIGTTVARDGGSVVVAGLVPIAGSMDFGIVKYTGGGVPDPGFNATGSVIVDVAGQDDLAESVAVQPDGKVLVAGTSLVGADNDYAVIRLDAGGTPDAAFWGGGERVVGRVPQDDALGDMVLLDSGRILLAGTSMGMADPKILLFRLKPDGALDPSFGKGGSVLGSFRGASEVTTAAEAGRGRVLVAGGVQGSNGLFRWAVARFLSDGSIDRSFGRRGVVSFGMGGAGLVSGIAVQADGRVVLTGGSRGNTRVGLARLMPDGSFDQSFGTRGRVKARVGSASVSSEDVVVTDGGLITVAGQYATVGPTASFAARFTQDGSYDRRFGKRGRKVYQFGTGENELRALVATPGGTVTVVGWAEVGPDADFVTARIQG